MQFLWTQRSFQSVWPLSFARAVDRSKSYHMTFGRFCCYPIWIVGLLSTFVEKYNIPIAPIRSPNDFIRVVNLWLFHGVSCLWGKIISPRAIKQMSSNKLGSLEHYYQKHISDLETPTLEDVLCFFLALWHMSFMYVFFCLRGGGGCGGSVLGHLPNNFFSL